ncbi:MULTISPECIES: biotin--[acetyl-CoA-carboxylase] ligase [Streptomyces]|uniref:biotin--[biotin carboxyl-carrier protein] ligase n=1 Tax=Streptomyces caviscabies TaxID=90079 RepID=A0ABW2MA11_9ACTN|nr:MULTISPECIES: biotin--[acetyl-CoA-carboxylase] ligase [Streptomyces]MDX2674845.1 biotin--[acetyl-CoA-carboxylase] ligase [Streptomyces sp. NRRL_ISP-5395]MDX3504285.1 biotin--[acetyl-CoA-carboxylase] ligase [Streptomyces sp. ATCC51928]MDX5519437.1 biotin--[acetyl-CoA-carboxylase] ligase [Streptomyces sp. DE06-01C]MDX5575920.1 biotin--[acetyl-CoA-carboxylase] ligase [Streptomyces sp. ID01-9D]WKN16978.1 biotin--[acetyl-CoA-carboxylase] ligase [Streptomyces sp. JUS-F4]
MTPPDAPHNRWSDLDRPPLNVTALRRGLLRPDALWTSLEVVESTGSTNTDLAGRARTGAVGEGAVLVAEEQTAGRGRLERTWTAPPRSGLFLSVHLEPGDIPVERWGWVPLLAGVAAATGLAKSAGVDMSLKWPNDLLVSVEGEERKTGGILGEFAGDGIVVGLGINVSLRADELPAPTAGSLALAGAVSTDRETLLRAVLRSLEDWYGRWKAAGGDAAASGLQAAYAAGCATLDRTVRAELPGGKSLVGEAVAIDGDGRLVLSTEGGLQQPVSAGDIVHLRGAAGGLT